MDDDQQFCLRWNNHQSTLISVFDTLLENGTLVDCTLAAEGKFLKAHKVVLCACSPYFASLLSQQYDKHPIFILKDVKFQELRAMMDYMYRGEVNISQDQLAALLKAAESLQIKGLSDNRGGGGSSSAAQKIDAVSAPTKSVPSVVPSAAATSKSGLTIEQHKRPLKHIATDAELSGSREGSTSPSARKRKKVRRRSIDTNNTIDNHDQLSNSSSQSSHQQQTQPLTSTPLALSQINTATSAANVLNVTKKTDIHNTNAEQRTDDDDDDDGEEIEQDQPKQHKRHKTTDNNKDKNLESELLIEPKSEYEDGEPVEDLTMDDEELLEDLEQAGPSHGGEGSSQGYAQWQVDRSQDEVFLATQEAAGQHRDAQDKLVRKSGLLDNDNIVVSRKANSYVLTAVVQTKENKRTYNSAKKLNGAEAMLKKAGAEGVSLSVMRTRSQQAAAEKAPEVTVINKNLTLVAGKAAEPKIAITPLTELANDPQRRKSLNQSLASKSSGSKIIDEIEVEDYMEFTELADFEEITFDPAQMTAIIDKEENITFTQDTLSNASHDNYSISFATDTINNDEITFSEGSNSCTFKIEYPISETSSVNQSEENSNSNSGSKPFACRHCGKEYRWKSTLRRHENVECGGKAPSYECPYCEYKAKQRGNLGVHVRKHHPDLPKLESRRKKHD